MALWTVFESYENSFGLHRHAASNTTNVCSLLLTGELDTNKTLIFFLFFFRKLHQPLDYIASPSTVIPLLLLLILIIYYLISLTNALREANEDLKNQLRRERQEERRKMLQRVVHAKLDDNGNGSNAMDRWRKVLEASSPLTPNAPGQIPEPADEEKMQARKELLARIMKKALRKGSNTSEDESHDGGGDDETDTEQHESLPHDQDVSPKAAVARKEPTKHLLDDKKASDSKHVRKPSFARMIIDAAKKADQAAKEEQSKSSKSPSPDKVEEVRAQPPPKAVAEDDGDENLNEKVVSERRLLRRQQSIQDSIASGSLAKVDSLPTEKDEVNYEIVNEKNKAVEKKAKQKTKVKVEPEIFKFDKEDIKKEQTRSEKAECDDAKSKEVPTSTKTEKASVLSQASSSSKSPTSSDIISQLPQQSAKPAKQTSQRRHRERNRSSDRGSDISPIKKPDEPPKYATVIKPTAEAIQPKKSVADTNSSKKFNVSPTKDKDKSESESTSPIDKPIKKLNSFLALVREAVQAKKQEQSPSPSPPPAPPPTVLPSVRAIPDLPSRVKKYIDDSVSISEDGSTTKTSDSQSSQNITRSSSKRKRQQAEHAKQLKRRDSQTSIWSDNIPVITISKTESEECILEKSTDEAEDNLDDDIN